jgi:MtN3 and saliva related transmembrane protein
MLIDMIGTLAGTLTTAAFVPQAVKVWRTRSARDISFWMYLVFLTGVALWLLYGVLIESWPVILANVATFILALFILVIKLRHG